MIANRLADSLQRNKLVATLSFLFISLFLFGFAFGLSVLDPSVAWRAYSYSFIRQLSKCDYDWATIESDSQAFSTVKELRNDLYQEGRIRGIYGRDIFGYVVASDESLNTIKQRAFVGDAHYSDVSLINLSTYCDGNTSEENVLYAAPLRIMFSNNTTCDIRRYSGPDGSAYISDRFADFLLSQSPSLGGYERILGSEIRVGSRAYAVSNIYYSNDEIAPYLAFMNGEFVITNDTGVFEEGTIKAAMTYRRDSVNHNDSYKYMSRMKPSKARVSYISNGRVQTDDCGVFFSSRLIKGQTSQFPAFWCILVFFLLDLPFAIFSYLIFMRGIAPRWVFILAGTLFVTILFIVNVLNLFFYSNPFLLCVFNEYVTVAALTFFVALIIGIFNKHLKKKMYRRGENDEFVI